MAGREGYDIGGAELPISPDLVVVDKLTQSQWIEWCRTNGIHKQDRPHYVRLDVTAPLWGEQLAPKPFVHCSRLLRHLPGVTEKADKHDPDIIRRFASELVKTVAVPGVLVVYDYSPLVWEVLREIQSYATVCNWWFVAGTELIEVSDGMFPAQTRATFVRTPNPFGV